MFSSFSSPSLSALLTFLIFIIGHLSSSLRDLAEGLGSRAAVVIFEVIYYLFPNLAHFSFRSEAAVGMVPSPQMLGGGLIYAVVYSAIMLTIAVLIFNRRNFK